MRHVLALVTLGLLLILTASASYAGNGTGYGPVLEIRRSAGTPQDAATGPGYTPLPSSQAQGYDAGYVTVVPVQPFWVVQFQL